MQPEKKSLTSKCPGFALLWILGSHVGLIDATCLLPDLSPETWKAPRHVKSPNPPCLRPPAKWSRWMIMRHPLQHLIVLCRLVYITFPCLPKPLKLAVFRCLVSSQPDVTRNEHTGPKTGWIKQLRAQRTSFSGSCCMLLWGLGAGLSSEELESNASGAEGSPVMAIPGARDSHR